MKNGAMMRVVYTTGAPTEAWDCAHTLSIECHGNSNDGYFQLEITATPDHDEDGLGWVEVPALIALMDWCRKHGAVNGETVLISHGW